MQSMGYSAKSVRFFREFEGEPPERAPSRYRQFGEITPEQRDACLARSNYTEVDLIRQEAKNERQLRWALKLYWETEKEDAARAAQPQGRRTRRTGCWQILE